MKKSLLILSMLALTATSARAYDTLEAGTADAPNYYLIKAVSDGTYASYTADAITAGNSTTNLTRVADPTANSVWAVTPGTDTNSLTIKNYTGEHYLVQFQDEDGSESTVSGGFANVASSAVNIYPNSLGNGHYSLRTQNRNYDYSGGTNPIYAYMMYAPANDVTFQNTWNDGTQSVVSFQVYKLTITDGTDVQTAIQNRLDAIPVDDAKGAAIAKLNGYIENVPPVAEVLTPYIAQVNAATSIEGVNAVVTEAEAAGNAVLAEGLNNQVYALKNVRRAALGRDAFVALNAAANNYGQSAEMNTPNAWFKFTTIQTGYYLTNMGDNKWVANDAPSDSEASFVYPILYTSGNYSGISFPFSAEHTGNGFNMNSGASGSTLTSWAYTDEGSIWAIVNVWDTYAVPTIDALNAYAATTAPVNEYFTAPVADINALGYTADLVTKPAELLNSAISQANTDLKTVLDGKIFAVKNERNQGYLYPNGAQYNVTANPDDNTWFKFTADPDHEGAYFMQNLSDGMYVSSELAPSADSKLTVYPTVNHSTYYGFTFCNAETSIGIDCFNYNGKLLYWTRNDPGAIWSLYDVVEEIATTATEKLSKYVENVGPAAEIFTKAIEDINSLTVSDTYATQVTAISDKAFADADALLGTALAGKVVSVHSLRNGYVVAGEDGYTISQTETDLANYDFEAAEDGGYYMYSPASKKYLGPAVAEEGTANQLMTAVDSKDDAVKVYPFIFSNGDKYGVCLSLSDSNANNTVGLNTGGKLYQYYINDAGSIFSIKVMGDSTGIEEITAGESAAQGIYDLSGRRLSAPVRGINIINGRKVLVK